MSGCTVYRKTAKVALQKLKVGHHTVRKPFGKSAEFVENQLPIFLNALLQRFEVRMLVHGFDLLYKYKEKGRYSVFGNKMEKSIVFSSRLG